MLNTNRVKSLAALFEEAFRATEKPAKKALPKEDGNKHQDTKITYIVLQFSLTIFKNLQLI